MNESTNTMKGTILYGQHINENKVTMNLNAVTK